MLRVTARHAQITGLAGQETSARFRLSFAGRRDRASVTNCNNYS